MIHEIRETNFGNAWHRILQNILKDNNKITFGVEEKAALDSTQLIELTGRAIDQILAKDTHPLSTFKALDSYTREFTYEFLKDYNKKKHWEKFDYLYMDRLAQNANISERWDEPIITANEDCIDQINWLKRELGKQKKTQIGRNDHIATTWYPDVDGTDDTSSPCLQIVQVRWNQDDLVDVNLIWRSRDAYNAWQANLVALVGMINEYVIAPNNCRIGRVTDYSTSLHIYEGDIEQAKRVTPGWYR